MRSDTQNLNLGLLNEPLFDHVVVRRKAGSAARRLVAKAVEDPLTILRIGETLEPVSVPPQQHEQALPVSPCPFRLLNGRVPFYQNSWILARGNSLKSSLRCLFLS